MNIKDNGSNGIQNWIISAWGQGQCNNRQNSEFYKFEENHSGS